MTVEIIARSRQRDGTTHLEAKAPAGTDVDDLVEVIKKKIGYHEDCLGWGEVKDGTGTDTWVYLISIEP